MSRETTLGRHGPAAHETDHLLGTATRKSHSGRIGRYLKHELETKYADLLLLACYIITGLLDSSAVFVWGSFVSMQTGNTVYLGLGLSGADHGTRWIRSGTSIVSFCLGSLCFAAFHRCFPSPRQRWVLCASFTFQLALVTAAALIVTITKPSKDAGLDWKVLVPLGMVAFQSSGQAVSSRILKYNGLTSVVLTSVYCDLFSHPDFLSPRIFEQAEQRRRAGAIICVLIGTSLGGLWARSSYGVAASLWTAVVFKAVIVIMWLLWKRAKTEDGDEQA